MSRDKLMEEAMAAATAIAAMSQPSRMLTKADVNRAYETTLAEGIKGESLSFYSLFAIEDQKEGMAASGEKRAPAFKNR